MHSLRYMTVILGIALVGSACYVESEPPRHVVVQERPARPPPQGAVVIERPAPPPPQGEVRPAPPR